MGSLLLIATSLRAEQLQAGPASWRARQGNSSKGCPCRQQPWSTSDSRGSRPSIQHPLQPHHCTEGGRGRAGGLPPPQNPQGAALQVATDPPEKLLRAPASCPLPAWKAAALQWAGPAGSPALRKGSNTQSIPIGPCNGPQLPAGRVRTAQLQEEVTGQSLSFPAALSETSL